MPEFKTLDDLGEVSGKVALVRVDLNLPMKDGSATDVSRVEAVKPTILELAEKGAKVLLLAHYGRPKGQRFSTMSTSFVQGDVEKVLDKDVLKKVEEAGLTLYSMDEVMAAGIDHMPNFTPIQAAYEDCFMFSYTSGTTGDPKGVMLTHKMVVNCVASLNLRLDGIQG